jgi:hypothetical protein
MTTLSDSYLSRVLGLRRGLDVFARRWRWLRSSLFDPYRPELHYLRGAGPKWRKKHARSVGSAS